MRQVIYKLIIIILYSFYTPGNLYAIDFSLSPTTLKMEMNPGETKEFSLKISNQEKKDIKFQIYVTDIVAEGKEEIDIAPKEEAGGSKWSCAKWIEIDSAEVTIPGEKEEEIKGRISIPPGNVGGRYAAIVCEDITKDEEIDEGAAIQLKMEVVCVVELTINGIGQEESLEIKHIAAKPASDSWEFDIFVQNTGNIHVPAKGMFFVMDGDKRIVGRGDIVSSIDSNVILPEETCKYTASLKKTLSKGTYTVLTRLYYGQGNIPVERKIDFTSKGILSHLRLQKGWKGDRIPFCVVDSPVLDLKLLPGRFSSRIITIKNIRDEDVHVKTRVKDFEIDMAGEIIFTEIQANLFSAVSWIKIEPSEFDIPEGGEKRIRVLFEVPKGIKGGYYAGLLFDISTRAGLNSSENSLILMSVGDTVDTKLEVSEFDVQQQEGNTRMNFSMVFENKGDVHLQPSSSFILRNNDRLIDQMQVVNKGDIMLLPTGKRKIEFSIDTNKGLPFPEGEYEAVLIVECAGMRTFKVTKSFNIGDESK